MLWTQHKDYHFRDQTSAAVRAGRKIPSDFLVCYIQHIGGCKDMYLRMVLIDIMILRDAPLYMRPFPLLKGF